MLELPWLVGRLLDVASTGERPAFATRAFDIVMPLWLHFQAERQAQETAGANMQLLLGDRYEEDTGERADDAGTSGPRVRALLASYSGTVALESELWR